MKRNLVSKSAVTDDRINKQLSTNKIIKIFIYRNLYCISIINKYNYYFITKNNKIYK